MFMSADPVWSAATLAAEVAKTSSDPDKAFVESFLHNLVGMLSDDALAIFGQVIDSMDSTYRNPTFHACEVLRGLRHASKRGVSAPDVIARFGLAEITLEGLLDWLISDHGFAIIERC